MYQRVILEGFYHEEGKIDAACNITLEDGVTHMPTPHGEALALTLFEAAATHNSPQRITIEHQIARHHLIVDIHHTKESTEPVGYL